MICVLEATASHDFFFVSDPTMFAYLLWDKGVGHDGKLDEAIFQSFTRNRPEVSEMKWPTLHAESAARRMPHHPPHPRKFTHQLDTMRAWGI